MSVLVLITLIAGTALAQEAPAAEPEDEQAPAAAEPAAPAPPAIDFSAATPLDGAPSPYDLSRALEGGCDDGADISIEAVDLERAQSLGDLTTAQAEWLEPKLVALPQNPRAQTDYTAYILEPGEVLLGLTTYLGILSNMQVGTNLLLNSLRVYNFNVKIDAIQEGPVDVALIVSRFQLVQEDYMGSYTGLGGLASVQVLDAWSIHAGGEYNIIRSMGAPDLSQISPLLGGGGGVSSLASDAEFFGSTVRLRAATDYRFNRRDSVVLQFASNVFSRRQTEGLDVEALPDILGLRDALSHDGVVPVSGSYVTSVAWQFRWRRAELRLGVGWSGVSPPDEFQEIESAYRFTRGLTQATEFAYRFGGKTRIKESRQRKTWRRNVEEAVPGPAPTGVPDPTAPTEPKNFGGSPR